MRHWQTHPSLCCCAMLNGNVQVQDCREHRCESESGLRLCRALGSLTSLAELTLNLLVILNYMKQCIFLASQKTQVSQGMKLPSGKELCISFICYVLCKKHTILCKLTKSCSRQEDRKTFILPGADTGKIFVEKKAKGELEEETKGNSLVQQVSEYKRNATPKWPTFVLT